MRADHVGAVAQVKPAAEYSATTGLINEYQPAASRTSLGPVAEFERCYRLPGQELPIVIALA